ncbi:hypothetical protein K503DRAFT_492086 [Rhizopogon vinicolor AM-OR11-026]|uniref:G-protein coupled receptors family 1 profile domain-containing protein n=1 Tax=Rhizopogon vinicolor AM-OR11-026 TaxID=1314800 RepID=A0A1B7MMG2_9AGAM|nr:hypothetical protein K503DRAFT_492086 [Rhizopogon vinicolor AM-OR11-026]
MLLIICMCENGPGIIVSKEVCTVFTILDVWGALASSMFMQAIMHLRVYAMYERRREVLVLLYICFIVEILAAITIVWCNFGPGSAKTVDYHHNRVHGNLTCYNNGTHKFSAAAFIPFLCVEILLFLLAICKAIVHLRDVSRISGEWELRSMMRILVRDSILYFFGNIISMVIFAGLWSNLFGSYTELVSAPFLLLINTATSSHLILSIRHTRDSSKGLVIEGRTSHETHELTTIDRFFAAGHKQGTFDPCVVYDIGAV